MDLITYEEVKIENQRKNYTNKTKGGAGQTQAIKVAQEGKKSGERWPRPRPPGKGGKALACPESPCFSWGDGPTLIRRH